jgi:4-amino-4-deoxy-L-arabinose transferase-like glycosyltransferase
MKRLKRESIRLSALSLILVVGASFRFWGLTWGLRDANVSRRPHPDEWATYWLFRWFGAHHDLNPCPAQHGQCFFDWGMVYPYVAYLGRAVLSPIFALLPAQAFGPHADTSFVTAVLAGRFVSALASTAAVLVAYRLGSRAYGWPTGLVAALGVAVSGLLIQLAHFATPDSMTVLLASIALLLAYEAACRPTTRRFALAGGAVGLATGCEYHMALLAVPLVVAWAGTSERPAGAPPAAILAALAAFLVSNPYSIIDAGGFLAALDHAVRIRTVDSGLQYQGRFAAYGPDWLYLVRYPLGYGVGFPLALWMVGATVWAGVRRRPVDVILLSWILVYGLLITLSPAKFMRYGAPILPPLAVFSARLLVDLLVSRRALWRSLATTAAVLTLAFTASYDAAYAGLFALPDARYAATQWIDHHAATGSRIAFETLPNGLTNLAYFVSSAGYRPCFSQFHAGRIGDDVSLVATDDYQLEEHPRATADQVLAFRRALRQSNAFQKVAQVRYVPTFLGMSFPIDSSPHDWRYPSHEITLYRPLKPLGRSPSLCFPTLRSAIAALYVRGPAS